MGEFEVWDPIMMNYLQKVKDLTSVFRYFEISHILRIENARSDVFFRFTTTPSNLLGHTFIKYLEQSSIDKVDEVL